MTDVVNPTVFPPQPETPSTIPTIGESSPFPWDQSGRFNEAYNLGLAYSSAMTEQYTKAPVSPVWYDEVIGENTTQLQSYRFSKEFVHGLASTIRMSEIKDDAVRKKIEEQNDVIKRLQSSGIPLDEARRYSQDSQLVALFAGSQKDTDMRDVLYNVARKDKFLSTVNASSFTQADCARMLEVLDEESKYPTGAISGIRESYFCNDLIDKYNKGELTADDVGTIAKNVGIITNEDHGYIMGSIYGIGRWAGNVIGSVGVSLESNNTTGLQFQDGSQKDFAVDTPEVVKRVNTMLHGSLPTPDVLAGAFVADTLAAFYYDNVRKDTIEAFKIGLEVPKVKQDALIKELVDIHKVKNAATLTVDTALGVLSLGTSKLATSAALKPISDAVTKYFADSAVRTALKPLTTSVIEAAVEGVAYSAIEGTAAYNQQDKINEYLDNPALRKSAFDAGINAAFSSYLGNVLFAGTLAALPTTFTTIGEFRKASRNKDLQTIKKHMQQVRELEGGNPDSRANLVHSMEGETPTFGGDGKEPILTKNEKTGVVSMTIPAAEWEQVIKNDPVQRVKYAEAIQEAKGPQGSGVVTIDVADYFKLDKKSDFLHEDVPSAPNGETPNPSNTPESSKAPDAPEAPNTPEPTILTPKEATGVIDKTVKAVEKIFSAGANLIENRLSGAFTIGTKRGGTKLSKRDIRNCEGYGTGFLLHLSELSGVPVEDLLNKFELKIVHAKDRTDATGVDKPTVTRAMITMGRPQSDNGSKKTKYTIVLGEQADAFSVLHEMTHMYLDLLKQLAEENPQSHAAEMFNKFKKSFPEDITGAEFGRVQERFLAEFADRVIVRAMHKLLKTKGYGEIRGKVEGDGTLFKLVEDAKRIDDEDFYRNDSLEYYFLRALDKSFTDGKLISGKLDLMEKIKNLAQLRERAHTSYLHAYDASKTWEHTGQNKATDDAFSILIDDLLTGGGLNYKLASQLLRNSPLDVNKTEDFIKFISDNPNYDLSQALAQDISNASLAMEMSHTRAILKHRKAYAKKAQARLNSLAKTIEKTTEKIQKISDTLAELDKKDKNINSKHYAKLTQQRIKLKKELEAAQADEANVKKLQSSMDETTNYFYETLDKITNAFNEIGECLVNNAPAEKLEAVRLKYGDTIFYAVKDHLSKQNEIKSWRDRGYLINSNDETLAQHFSPQEIERLEEHGLVSERGLSWEELAGMTTEGNTEALKHKMKGFGETETNVSFAMETSLQMTEKEKGLSAEFVKEGITVEELAANDVRVTTATRVIDVLRTILTGKGTSAGLSNRLRQVARDVAKHTFEVLKNTRYREATYKQMLKASEDYKDKILKTFSDIMKKYGSKDNVPQKELMELYSSILQYKAMLQNANVIPEFKEMLATKIKRVQKLLTKSKEDLGAKYDINELLTAGMILQRLGNFAPTNLANQIELIRRNDRPLYDSVNAKIEAAGIKRIDNMTLSELEDAVSMIDESIAKARGAANARESAKAIAGEVAHVVSQNATKKDRYGNETPLRKLINSIKHAVLTVDALCTMLDGSRNGVVRKYLFTPLREASTLYAKASIHCGKFFNSIVKELKERDRVFDSTKFYNDLNQDLSDLRTVARKEHPELAQSKSFSSLYNTTGIFKKRGATALFQLCIHMGNTHNIEALAKTLGILPEQVPELAAMLVNQGHITKDFMDLVQSYWDFQVDIYNNLNKSYYATRHVYLPPEEPAEISFNFGGQIVTFRGGYTPIVREHEEHLPKDIEDAISDYNAMAPRQSGATKERKEGVDEPIKLELQHQMTSIDSSLKSTYLYPATQRVYTLLKQGVLKDAFDLVDEKLIDDVLIPWLSDTYEQRSIDSRGASAATLFLYKLSSNVNLSYLSFNISNTLQNLLNFAPAIPLIGHKGLFLGFTQRMSLQEIKSKSQFITNRCEFRNNSIGSTIHSFESDTSKLKKAEYVALKHGYILQTKMQEWIDSIIWSGAYKKYISEHNLDPHSAEEIATAAIHEADEAVRVSQGSFDVVDSAKLTRSTPLVKMLTPFCGYFISVGNYFATEWTLAGRGEEATLVRELFRRLGLLTCIIIIPACGSLAIREAINGKPSGQTDEERALAYAVEPFKYGAAMIHPVAATGINALANSIQGNNTFNDSLLSAPVVSVLTDMIRKFSNVATGEHPEKVYGLVEDLLRLTGATAPVVGASKSMQKAVERLENN